jgi:hypothetical protein
MPPKVLKPKIPDIPWDDDDKLVWEFITECEKDINYKVLFGKKGGNRGALNHRV